MGGNFMVGIFHGGIYGEEFSDEILKGKLSRGDKGDILA